MTTLRLRTEFGRQASRRRTHLTLGFMVLLPLILVAAFKLGPSEESNGNGGFFDLATSGALNFTVFTLLVSSSFLLVVVVALCCGDAVASEASWGSLRYLLAAPVPRSRLLVAKLTIGLVYSAIALVLLAATALVSGTLAFGWHSLRTPVGDDLAASDALLRIAGGVGYIAVNLLIVAGLAFLLSVSTDAPLGAVGGAVLLWIVSSILDQVSALGELRNVLPTRYSDAWVGLLSTPVRTDDLVLGGIAAVLYASVFVAFAWWRFLRKDITS